MEKLEFQLKIINAEATHMIDGLDGERVGTTIIIPKGIEVLDKGTKGDESFAWAKIRTGYEDIRIGLVYAPNEGGTKLDSGSG